MDKELSQELTEVRELKEQAEYARALRRLQKLVLTHGQTAAVFEELADTYFALEQYRAGRKALRRAEELSPASPFLHFLRGYVHALDRQWSVAVQDFEYAAHYMGLDVELLRHWGWALFQKGERVTGMALLERARTMSPINIFVLLDLGQCYYKLNRLADAEDCFYLVTQYDSSNQDARQLWRRVRYLQSSKTL